MRRYIFLFILIFFSFPYIVNAGPFLSFPSNPEWYESHFLMVSYSSADRTNFLVSEDSNGVFYWEDDSFSPTEIFFPTTEAFPLDNCVYNIPTFADGYSLYIAYNRNEAGSDNRFRGTDCDDTSSWFTSVGTIVSTFTVDGTSIDLVRWNGVSASHIYSKNMSIDAPKCSGGSAVCEIYLVSYTDEDLSYINTESELYEYIGAFEDFAVDSFVEIVEPTQSTSTPSRTIDVIVDGRLDGSYPTSVDKLFVDFFSFAYPEDAVERIEFDYSGSPFLQTFSTSTTLNRDGQYLMTAYFTDGEDQAFLTDSITFNSATTSIILDIPEIVPDEICDDSGFFDTAICKTLVFLFYPSNTAIDRYKNLDNLFADKIPFGYFVLLNEKIASSSLSSSTAPSLYFDFSTTTSGLGNLKIIDLDDLETSWDLSTVWLVIRYILWLAFISYLIARIISVGHNL